MELALEEARKAADEGEVPVGAVLVSSEPEPRLLARDHNRREDLADPTAHAELLAVRAATGQRNPGRWRLPPATLYVTLEPCVMCMGALVLARLERLVYAASDPKGGAAKTLYELGNDPRLNHEIEVVSGVLEEEGAELLRAFFRALRSREEPASPAARTMDRLGRFRARLCSWADAHEDIRALILVGSHARGEARAESDIDLIVVCADREPYLAGDAWLQSLGSIRSLNTKRHGALTSRRVIFEEWGEVELSLAGLGWAREANSDPQTRRALERGAELWYDPEGLMSGLRRGGVAGPPPI
jgi:tRNA(adenine34) deaminase